MRTNSADYLVPELLKVDNTCGPHLMKEIRSVHPTPAHTHAGAGTDESYGGILWGLVQVTLHARALTLPGNAIVPQGSGGTAELSDQEVLWACLSSDVDLRLAALTLLTGMLPLQNTLSTSLMLSSNTTYYCSK
jgi:Na+/proline symporter